MKILQILVFPFSLLYGLILLVRNILFDFGIFKQKSYEIPIISVGNLNMGGTGKTPHIEYLIRLLKSEFSLATISRGYGRKTKGYIKASLESTCEQIGDEPKQYKQKFQDVEVIVDENRNEGIEKIITENNNIDIILLDDAYQHRSVRPGLSILLTDYHKLFSSDYMLPTGTLREFRGG
ncbi:MAG: tetraacyldisaccharide 4'-kinase, partial [Bacteroidetes bacterium]|nr:tetraacyldisaccharide 4'-kinase [Bacteroidota bacterium]